MNGSGKPEPFMPSDLGHWHARQRPGYALAPALRSGNQWPQSSVAALPRAPRGSNLPSGP